MSAILWKHDPAVVWAEPLLKGLKSEEYLAKLKKKLKGRVVEAWLFGSYAKSGDSSKANDIDLILIAPCHAEFQKRAGEFTDIALLSTRADILVYTPTEWEELKTEGTGFWGEVNRSRVRVI